MIHYLLIRRDLPFGVTLAQLAHAAANSMEDWLKWETGTSPSDMGSLFDTPDFPPHEPMTVVVLGVRDRISLERWQRKLNRKKVRNTVVREPDAPWHNQMMAIGVWPGEKADLSDHFKRLDLISYQNWEARQ